MFSYYGSKSKVVRKYPAPQHRTVIEPFAGAAHYSVYHAVKGNIDRAILIDKDPIVCAVWRYLIQADPDEVRNLPVFHPGQEIKHDHQGARLLLRFLHDRGRAQPSTHAASFVTYYAKDRGRPHEARTALGVIADQLPYIRNFQIIQGGYHNSPDIEATHFIDPPYQYDGGEAYTYGSDRIPYDDLARKVKQWRGLKIVCEGPNADWLPFRYLCRQQGAAQTAPVEAIYVCRTRAKGDKSKARVTMGA